MKEKLLYFLSWIQSAWNHIWHKPPVDAKRILVVKTDEIGDMVTALHVFELLHSRYPSAQIDVQCRPFNCIWFTYLDYVNCIEHPRGSYDLFIVLRGDFNCLLPWHHKKARGHYILERGSVRLKNKFRGGQKNELDTNLQIIAPLMNGMDTHTRNRIRFSTAEQQSVKAWCAERGIMDYAVLHIGARDKSRRWPVDRFKEVIRHLNSKGISAVLAGGPADKELNESCIEEGLEPVNAAGEFNLLEFAALCEAASLFIGNESGPMHIASAMDTPVIALFGPGVKDVFYPKTRHHRIHHYFLDKGHTKQTVANSTIFKITTEEVIASVDALLSYEP